MILKRFRDCNHKVRKKVPLLVIGGGGHAKVIIDMVTNSHYEAVGILERDSAQIGRQIFGIPVIGTDENIPILFEKGIHHAIIAIGYLGDSMIRNQLAVCLHNYGFHLATLIHPSAIVSQNVTIGDGTVICAGAIVNPGVVIGENCIINTGTIIEHDVILGNNVHVAPNTVIAGSTIIEDDVFLGVGSCVIQNLRLGTGCIVGAGSVVLHDVNAGETVVGIPAKICKKEEL